MIANILTPLQTMMLREAAKSNEDDRSKRINEVIELIKRQSPSKFFYEDDPALRNRIFFDEPKNLHPSEYGGYKVQYVSKENNKV